MLLADCKTLAETLFAADVLSCLWDQRAPRATQNALLLNLLAGYQRREEEGLRYALLRLALYPSLRRVAARYPEFTWAEIHSAFYRAVERYPLHQKTHVALALRRFTARELLAENAEDKRALRAAEQLQQSLSMHSLTELMSGGLEREEAQAVLWAWVRRGWVFAEDVPHVLARLFPQRIARSAKERQRESRAFRRVREMLKNALSRQQDLRCA